MSSRRVSKSYSLGILGFGKSELEEFIDSQTETTDERDDSESPVEDSKSALDRIYSWWSKSRQIRIQQLERNLYPDSCRIFEAITPKFRGTSEELEAWLTLLLRGALETIGRTKPRAHLSFLQLAQDKRWMSQVVEASPDSSRRAIEILEAFLDRQVQSIEHFQWIKEFLSVSMFSKWLDQYAKAILSVNDMTGSLNLEEVFCPRINHRFERGGPDAPPLTQTLGIGVCFVMRELMRHGIITNAAAYRYCYMPTKGVREIIKQLGGPDVGEDAEYRYDRSSIIYDFLTKHLGSEKATFLHDFDIPLQILARDEELRRNILYDDD